MRMLLATALLATFAVLASPPPSRAADSDLVEALRAGGLVIVMRHAYSPEEPPDAAAANPDNPGGERQLDATGRATAAAMGEAVRALGIKMAPVQASTAYRTRETALRAGLGEPEIVEELGASASMSGAPRDMEALGAWLRARTAEPPPPGANALLITHSNYIEAAFGASAADVASGEALIFRPDGAGSATLVTRLPIEAWPTLVAEGP